MWVEQNEETRKPGTRLRGKALEDIHFAVARSYLRATGRQHGLILNFAKPMLEAKRVLAAEWPTR
jgi:hypothetical protein